MYSVVEPSSHIHQYPFLTRLSSDLIAARLFLRLSRCVSAVCQYYFRQRRSRVVEIQQQYVRASQVVITRGPEIFRAGVRSEEHTSEIQSLTNIVCYIMLD